MDLYSKCWRLEAARKVFDGLRLSALGFRNPVNTIIIGHCAYGESGDGIKLFHQMIRPGNVQMESHSLVFFVPVPV